MVEVNANNAKEVAEIQKAFLTPFDAAEVKIKPAKVSGNRALALHYIDSRLVMDRLDEVVGIDGWRDEYTVLPSGEVECRLSVKLGGAWVTKADVGGQSEQPDEGDRMKAAYSDALKRAAVKFGIGRFLYRMPQQWMDYDPVKKQIIRPQQQPGKPVAQVQTSNAPATGDELHRRLKDYDAKLAGNNLCRPGALLSYVAQCGVKAGYSAKIADWSGPAIQYGVEAAKDFDQTVKKNAAGAK